MKRTLSIILALVMMLSIATATCTVASAQEVSYELVIEKLPDKTEYLIGESLDLTGIIAKLKGNDGSVIDVSQNLFIMGFDNTSLGEKTVNLYYDIYSAEITVSVVKNIVVDLNITSNPDKISYNLGDDLDKSGLIVMATYKDGTDVDVTSRAYYTGFDSTTPGKKLVTASYQGFSDSFLVTVYDRTMLSIRIDKIPDKVTYKQGEALDTTGMVVSAVYSDNTSEKITDDVTLTGFNTEVIGVQTITVSYDKFIASFLVTVNETGAIASISVSSPPDKTFYLSGQALDTTGLVIKVEYTSGDYDYVTDGFTVTGFNTNKLGEQTLTISYENYQTYTRVKVGLLGDINLDGTVTIEDVTLYQKYLCNLADLSSEQLQVADTNFDARYSIHDATKIQKYLAGLIDSLM